MTVDEFFTGASALDPNTNILYLGYNRGIVRWNASSNQLIDMFRGDSIHVNGIGLSMVDRKGFFCQGNRKIYSFNLDGTPVPTFTYTASGGLDLIACTVDVENGRIFYSKSDPNNVLNNDQSSIERIDIENGLNWNGNQPTSRTRTLNSPATVSTISSNYIFFSLANQQQILRIDRNNPDLQRSITTFNIGIGNFLSLFSDNSFLYIGSDLGIGFKYSVDDFSLSNVIFIAGQSLSTILYHESSKTIFWGTSSNSYAGQGRIARISATNFVLVDSIATNASKALASFLIGDEALIGGAIAINPAYFQPSVSYVDLIDCGLRTNCSDCNSDTNFCGWSINMGKCIRTSNNAITTTMCPTMLDMTPVKGSISGNTTIKITSSVNIPEQSTCVFFFANQNLTVAGTVQGTSISCATPPSISTGVSVSVHYNNAPFFTNSLWFSYYNCSSPNCRSCLSVDRPECGWCASSGLCQSINSNCQNSVSQCPVVSDITPKSGPLSGVLVSLTVDQLASGPYQCQFGDTVVSANRVSANLLTCIAPPVSVETTVKLRLLSNNFPYTDDQWNFLYYSCNGQRSCSGCVSEFRPECRWCMTTATCSSNLTCEGNCPMITALTPRSLLKEQTTNVTMTVSRTIPSGDRYNCLFGNTSVPGVIVNSTSIVCRVPVNPLGFVGVRLGYDGWAFSQNSVEFQYYDCSGNTCSSCTGKFEDACQWCLTDNKCDVGPFPCSEPEAATCPAIMSISPDSGSSAGNTTITIFGDNFVSKTYSCSFGGEITPAIRINSSHLSCKSPAGLGTVQLSILSNGALAYTQNTVNFTYYDCHSFSSCGKCVQRPDCQWCLESATCMGSSDSCTGNTKTNECPRLISVTPDHCKPSGGTTITVEGKNLVRTNGEYKCSFGDLPFSSATYINSTHLTCQCPESPDTKTLNMSVRLYAENYFDSYLPFIYYDCKPQWDSCGKCSVNPICGWCFDSQTCTEVENCSNSGSWASDSCPEISSIQPDHSSFVAGDNITIFGNHFPKGIDVACRFTYEGNSWISPGDISNDRVICTLTPVNPDVIGSSGNVSKSVAVKMDLVYQLGTKRQSWQILSENNMTFHYVRCVSTHCGGCSGDYCGWCLSEMKCNVAGNCPIAWNADCPVVSDITPASGEAGTEITLSGGHFISSGIVATMSGSTVNVILVDNDTLRLTVPPGTAGDATLTLFYKGVQYAPGHKWTYLSPSKNDDTVTIVVAVLLGVLFIGCVGLAVFAVLTYRKRKPFEFQLELERPNFDSFAFADDPSYSFDVTKKKSANMAFLEKFLIEREQFIPILASITQATESENVARYLVYLLQEHNQAIPVIKRFVTSEVSEADSAVLFRANSMASKMFKFFSKMEGLPYVWNTLAVFVNEICIQSKSDAHTNRLISNNIEIEIDPSKLDNPEDEEINKLQLLLITQKIFNAILNSVNEFPVGLREICKFIYQTTKNKFPDSEYKSLGSFVFLRFICPAITAPHAYGLLKEPPNDHSQRKLILVSKILQNLANGILFGKKEEFMTKMNEFIENNLDKLQMFFENLVDFEDPTTPPTIAVPKASKENALVFLYSHINNQITKINKQLSSDSNNEGIIAELSAIIDRIGAPPSRRSMDA